MSDVPSPPADQLERLVPADVRDGTTDRGPQAERVWHGTVWSRLGRGDLAWSCWDDVDDPALRPWVEAERGRVLRELGLHTRAEEHDLAGLRRSSDPTDEAMLWIGLTADAVGTGATDEAPFRLAAAVDALESAPPGSRRDRQRLRLTWVETEVAASSGFSAPDGPWPSWDGGRLAYPEIFGSGTVFHRAKATLFRGAYTGDLAMLRAGVSIAPPILVWAYHLASADLGEDGALGRARTAWEQLVPPPHVEDEVVRGAVAHRMRGPDDDRPDVAG